MYEEYTALKKEYGIETASRITRFRLRHLYELIDMAKEEGNECVQASEIREVNGTHIFFEQEVLESSLEGLRTLQNDVPEMVRDWEVMDRETARKGLFIPAAAGAMCGPAGALWPYRLCSSILERLLKEHDSLKLESHTPVEGIEFDAASSTYKITTPRGCITTPTVIHANNAWVSHLVPGLRGKVFPLQAQMSAQTPPEDLSHIGNKHSYSFIHRRGFDYMTQRPIKSSVNSDGKLTTSGGEMMFGGGWAQAKNRGIDAIGLEDDTKVDYLAAVYLAALLPFAFKSGWGADNERTNEWCGVTVKNMWTGVIGLTADDMPWVGKVPSKITSRGKPKGKVQKNNGVKTGEWCSVGFGGEGMSSCWGCGTALARMMLGEDIVKNCKVKDKRLTCRDGEEEVLSWKDQDLEDWFPTEFLITEERVKKADITSLISEILSK
ncbi:hypothetical protein ABW20_dc0103617 [Dactylellina cionopaga]|nr:hypothetical protein ABW20_dc0103617 [Dactylellina cionopaga]